MDRSSSSMSANWSTPTLPSDSTYSIPRCEFDDQEKSSLSLYTPAAAHCARYKYEASTTSYSSTVDSSDVALDRPRRKTSPPPSKTSRQQVAFILITCLAQFLSLSALNQTVSPVMILAKYFEVEDYGNMSWFSASYSMSVGTFILPAGTCNSLQAHRS